MSTVITLRHIKPLSRVLKANHLPYNISLVVFVLMNTVFKAVILFVVIYVSTLHLLEYKVYQLALHFS